MSLVSLAVFQLMSSVGRILESYQWIRLPKYGSERTVYIPDGLVRILSEYVRLHRPGDEPDRYLFPGSRDPSQPATRPRCHDPGVSLALRPVFRTGCTIVATSSPPG